MGSSGYHHFAAYACVGLFSFPNAHFNQDFYSVMVLPQAIRGLVGLVFLFDLYTIYQHLLIHRIRRQLVEREELFHLISENAADMIAIVDMDGRRLFNSLSYQRVLGYSPEELQASSAFAIRRLSGSQFDQHVVEVFLSIPAETWSTIARNQRLVAALPSRLRNNHDVFRLEPKPVGRT